MALKQVVTASELFDLPQQTASAVGKRGAKPKPIVEFPEPRQTAWEDVHPFHEALLLHAARHGDSICYLHRCLVHQGDRVERSTLLQWAAGKKTPTTVKSLGILSRIERRYGLPSGYFKAKLPTISRAPSGHRKLLGLTPSEQRRFAWHLPDDFDRRPARERAEILEWVRTVVISGATDYRRYQAEASKHRYAIRFPGITGRKPGVQRSLEPEDGRFRDQVECELETASADAPRALAAEMAQLIRFKTATLTDIGFQRSGVWNGSTAFQKVEHLGLLFGALAAGKGGPVRGRGVPPDSLVMGLLVFPAIWDWYIQWREAKRGFFTVWEVNMLQLGLSLTRAETGWLRQSPALAGRLQPIHGLVSQADIEAVRADWQGACDRFYKHGLARSKEVQRVARVHRDPFEPIMPILEADSPVGEYRRITEEIIRLMPDHRRYPRQAAEAVRSFLMLRLGLHLGLRQKNLREMLVCPPGRTPTADRALEFAKRGELRWSERDGGWEVLVPASAFKNANSSFFGNRPFRLVLPDLGGLYGHINAYIGQHRAVLLNGAGDPGTFFVKTMKITSRNASYDMNTFYEAWRLTIQRYGIRNPYTGRGAIEGLLPHGPHNVRDVLATHILKQTGSYEQASYAIQDTPETVAQHYGRFLPQDKAALAAQILNRVWEAA
ncbi:hypothetical protein [Novosphingobium sp. CECT 9465]|uniref:hypothetical protein n=1 Tax=Novosphingobium sp. CECT 9465 TaxID=2829794 RepID=UPI001E3AB77B|nr:hypothetical protein [Novosphingobium sp. CECT 9465]CAH0496378.1 hypothetical protein NVSP9465_01410 [Novosphingobium sp. CECT 9465]